MIIQAFAAAILLAIPLSAQLVLPVPEGTEISTSFTADETNKAANLIDGDASTFMIGGNNTAPTPTTVNSVFLRFPKPLKDLGGVETGESDPFHNYYPIEMEFWADSNNDGRYDTKLGSTRQLGPARQSAGKHIFDGRLPEVYGLELRVTEQASQGVKRAFRMNEIGILRSTTPPVIKPDSPSHRVILFKRPVPESSTVRSSHKTEDAHPPENLLDGNPKTFLQHKQGTALDKFPPSLFLTFPKPVTDLAGIEFGESDPYSNYIWLEMEVYADTTGDGKYDTQVGKFTGAAPGERRFSSRPASVHGLEMRVTKQKVGGATRSFFLNEIRNLVFIDDPGEGVMRYVLEDFEDFASWRTHATNSGQPEGERAYGQNLWLSGLHDPGLAKNGQGVGQLRYWFKDNGEPKRIWATRGEVRNREAIIDQLRFWANPKGYPAKIWFELLDARDKKFTTPAIDLTGNDWKEYFLNFNATTIPQLANLQYPFRLNYIFMSSEKGGKGDILLDDLTVIGAVDRGKRVQIRRVYEGISYNPDSPLVVSYTVRNVTDKPLSTPLESVLYSSFDPTRQKPVATVKTPLTIPPHTAIEVKVDFGKIPQGHYQALLSVSTPTVEVVELDMIAVMKPNGKRINKTPMWFGSMHPGDWIAAPENAFVLNNVVVPLGLDCYRTGPPDKNLLETDLLFAAGFGDMPPHLRKPADKAHNKGEPNDYAGYETWVARQARDLYLPHKDRIISVEFYNEPDLPGFIFNPGIDTYLKMHEIFRRNFRKEIPGVRIGTGSGTVVHAGEKKDFNKTMYTELAKETDVAVFHAHGPFNNYKSHHRKVEQWLAAGGRPASEALLGNSESGEISRSSPVGWLDQAATLVKKVGWAKSQANSLFYIWFTTTDTFDPQGGYLDGDNWGLVTYNQRIKPSGQAYNEVIRQLANTRGLGETALDPRLTTTRFLHQDGSETFLTWPADGQGNFSLPLNATGPVSLTDIFGLSTTLTPVNGQVTLKVSGQPLYLTMAKGQTLTPATSAEYVEIPDQIPGSPGRDATLAIALKNTFGKNATFQIGLNTAEGDSMTTTSTALTPGQEKTETLTFSVPARISPGLHGLTLTLESAGAGLAKTSFPLSLAIPLPVPKQPATSTITLNQQADTRDLAFDPGTAYWAGAEDLSATISLSHDSGSIRFVVTVTDQTHQPGPASEKLAGGDSIEIAFGEEKNLTHIGLTESNGGFGWIWKSAGQPASRKFETPLSVKRAGNTTTYEATIPLELLGTSYQPGLPLRAALTVNENDGGGRVRVLKSNAGIAPNPDPGAFGHILIE